jgi:type II secretory pathway component PulM
MLSAALHHSVVVRLNSGVEILQVSVQKLCGALEIHWLSLVHVKVSNIVVAVRMRWGLCERCTQTQCVI